MPGETPGGNVYVLEVNPRASRTVPFLSKVTGVPMVRLATRIMLGQTLAEQGYADWRMVSGRAPLVAVKGPVFSMAQARRRGDGARPGDEEHRRGDGHRPDLPAALQQGAAGRRDRDTVRSDGAAFVSIADRDKAEALPILKELGARGYRFYATPGTAG